MAMADKSASDDDLIKAACKYVSESSFSIALESLRHFESKKMTLLNQVCCCNFAQLLVD